VINLEFAQRAQEASQFHASKSSGVHHKRAFKKDLAGLCKALLARKWLGPLSVHAFSPALSAAKKAMVAIARRAKYQEPPGEKRAG
jgi:hypothetical protein